MTDLQIPDPEPAPGDPDTAEPPAASVSIGIPPRCPTRTRLWRAGRLVEEGFAIADISDHLERHDDALIWLDLNDPDEADLTVLSEELGLHPLAVEDAVHDHQRPKVDRYRTHLFVNVYAVAFDPASGQVTTSEISAFVTPRALVTVRKAAFDIDGVVARWDDATELAPTGVGFLLHGFLDAVVDGQHEAVHQLLDTIDELEEQLFAPRPGLDLRRRGFELRKSVVRLRRVVTPMGEVVHRLGRADPEMVPERLGPYFADVDDHVRSAAEGLDSAWELVGSVLDITNTQQANELNEITRKLAAWAAIIAVPTAVTGFYGQNVPYPGIQKEWGFVVSCSIIIGLAGGLYVMLRRRGWL